MTSNIKIFKMKLSTTIILLFCGIINSSFVQTIGKQHFDTSNITFPIIVVTWDYKEATEKGIYIAIMIYKETQYVTKFKEIC